MSAVRRPSGLLSFCPAAWSVQGEGEAGQPRTVVHAARSAGHETGKRIFPLPSPGLRWRGSPSACPVTEPRPSGKNDLRVRRSAMRPLSPPRSSVRSPLLARMLVQPDHHRWHGARLLAEIRRSSLPHPSFLSWRRRALSACCAAGERQGSHGPHRPRQSGGTKKRRPPAWRPADVWSRFTDAARGIRTACRAGKRWPRNRRP